ncbi:MAG: NAD(P)H-dependent oxidoreductase [Gemmatimonadota bacterium]|nr:NAD(P)H-dependent oxidoreductase [Gemmatimonadota bacterium]
MTLHLLALAASLRKASINRRLLAQAAAAAARQGAAVEIAEFAEFDMPLFNADVQEASGFPPGAVRFQERLGRADGMLLASPEYNYSLPGTLKNAIDWLSRMRPVPLRGKSAFLLAASSGPIGGIRGLWQLRIPLEGLGAFVHPDMYTLPLGADAFAEDGTLREPKAAERLETLLRGYLTAATRLAGKAG